MYWVIKHIVISIISIQHEGRNVILITVVRRCSFINCYVIHSKLKTMDSVQMLYIWSQWKI